LAEAESIAVQSAGVQLMVFPEAFIAAYPKGEPLGAVVGSRSHGGREQLRRYFKSAVENADLIAAITTRLKLYIGVEVVELANPLSHSLLKAVFALMTAKFCVHVYSALRMVRFGCCFRSNSCGLQWRQNRFSRVPVPAS
jgi:hypothetical protein